MKNELNSVHLDGMIETCRIVGDVHGKTVAKLMVVTLHPNEFSGSSVSLSSQFDKLRHPVRVVADGALSKELRSLEREMRMERSTGKNLASPHPCSVDGVLRGTEQGDFFVEATDKGFVLTDMVKTGRDNNVARLTGRVLTTSFTDETARIQVQTPAGQMDTFIQRKLNADAWEAVSSGRVKKGDALLMSGPLFRIDFTDGKGINQKYMLVPHMLQKQKLDKKKAVGPTLS